VDADNVIVYALKQAEDNKDLILRCVETQGRPAKVTLRLPFAQAEWTGELTPWEIKTLRFDPLSRQFRVVDLLEEPLP